MRYFYLTIFTVFASFSLHAQLFPDRHTTSPSDGWKSCQESSNPNSDIGSSHWVMFDFQSVYQLSTVKMWNLNDPANLDEGLSEFRVDYSLDNTNWIEYGNFTINQSDGSSFYEGEEVFDFNGISARYVIITAVSNGGGTCYGFDEIRFYNGVSVPVELAELKIVCDDVDRKIQWIFADVSDYASVTIEKSDDGREWNGIYSTSSIGQLRNNGTYLNSYIDKSIETSKSNFYRLKIYDINGDYEYSEILEANCVLDENNIVLYPNPVLSDLTIDVEVKNFQTIEYTIQDILGKVVKKGEFEVFRGNNRKQVSTNFLAEGSYVLNLTINDQRLEKKFIKVNW